MREIKFRAKNENGAWVTGCLSVVKNKSGEAEKSYFISNSETSSPFVCRVIDETIGQYIGLKDHDGIEICEGDILDVIDYEAMEGAFDSVVWGLTKEEYGTYPAFVLPKFESEVNSFSQIFDSGKYSAKVVGNIHDNPELLNSEV